MESEESVQEQAYLVSRGVRPLALLDTCDLDETVMADRFVWLNQLAGKDTVIPFVLPREDFPCAMTGYAAATWVVDLLAWSYKQPIRQHHRIIGLLLGYSANAIAEHDAREFAGKPITARVLASSSSMGVPVKPTNEALGRASRMCRA